MDGKRKEAVLKNSSESNKKTKRSTNSDQCSDSFPNGNILISTLPECMRAVSTLIINSAVAVDMEGIAHGRDGALSLIQITAVDCPTVFLFDITTLRRAAFEEGDLRSLFEDKDICKVVFDIRNDADSLFHNYGIKMRNVYDIQVLYSLRFSERTDEFLKGLGKANEKLLDTDATERLRLHRLKVAATDLFTRDSQVWARRPLPKLLCDYAASDVTQLLKMKTLWGGLRYDSFVENTSQERMRIFLAAKVQVRGREKARRDFSLGSFGIADSRTNDDSHDNSHNASEEDSFGWEPLSVEDICDYDSDSGLCEY